MSRIRTIQAAYEEIVASDPGTSITLRAIRRAVTSGDIRSGRVGSKYLVDVDVVIDYFSGNAEGCDNYGRYKQE